MEIIPPEIYQALMLSGVALIAAATAYVVSVLSRMKREQDARAAQNQVRDQQRNEIQENIRRIVNGGGVQREIGGAATPMAIAATAPQLPPVPRTEHASRGAMVFTPEDSEAANQALDDNGRHF